MTLKPLSGVRVLDFTAFPPGGYCTIMLADLGAEIIRVEPPARRGTPSLVVGQVALSRGKRSMTLDMRHPAAAGILKRLAPAIDVVVENAKPGAMEARGFGYSQARAENPRIIWCAITGFGQSGPYADQPGHDLSYMAHSGLLAALAPDLPWHPGVQIAVPNGAVMAVVGVQAALLQRARSGEGCLVDISLSECATWTLSGGINPLSEKPMVIAASPDRRLYACSDGRHVAVASAEPRTWAALCEALETPQIAAKLHDRAEAASTTETLAKIFLTRPAAEWVERLGPSGAAVTLVNHAKWLLDDPHIQARGSIVESAGVPVPANPIRLATPDGSRTATAAAAPHLVGEDTEDVLASAGFSQAEIEDLRGAGVV
ncbi:CaiB/BaiF CoA-transferase family protein [Phenylobacterium sp.]|jgi:crotonobetainyl-CoA:carnitine CoA-transferase CaiB-like acyl-CoA transferase|uniref:CaiB/BaiF CoA transferase family protein n=1 Tax=Phenylobacterium sp. TaxID=1871053 RepID=UPI002F3EF1BB